MRTLYFDCFSGISGDMALGALIDAGADFEGLKQELGKLNLEEEYGITIQKVVKNGISAVKVNVITKEQGHSHSHTHSHGHVHHHQPHHHAHAHNQHGHGHTHGHVHTHPAHAHAESGHHVHRHYRDIVELIQNAGFNENVVKMALSIFERIGRAEAKIHGIPLENVHFHEVGAIDSIIDIVGTAICLDMLGIERFVASPVAVGGGMVNMDHGLYPVPAPATMELLRGVPLRQSDLPFELTTPTGAGILSALVEQYGPLPSIKVEVVGYGAGTRDFPGQPNVLRVLVGTSYE